MHRLHCAPALRNRLALVIVLVLLSSAGWAQSGGLPVHYTATSSQSEATLKIVIERWTTAAERAELIEVIKKSDSRLTLEALEQQERTGFVSLSDTMRFDLRYAAHFKAGEGRRLILVTDRPVSLHPDLIASGSVEQTMTIVDLTLDAEGNGTGTVVIGADAQLDEATGGVRIITAGAPPVRLEEVRRTN